MLKRISLITLAAFSLAVVWLLMTPAAYADDWDKTTRITVNQPFEIPGMVLPAGTYILKIVDLTAERHVVRFLSEDETKIYATLIGIPDFRLKPSESTVITFYETEATRPRPLHEWFYPNHRYGIEFAYPKTRAFEIAKVAEEPVVAFREPPAVWTEELPPPVITEWAEPLEAVTPAGEEFPLAEIYPEFTPVPEPELEPEFAAELALPRTATPFPLLGLVGLLAAGVAATLRFVHS